MRLAALLLALASLPLLRVDGASIAIHPAALAVAPGGTFSLNVDAQDVVDLYAFQFDINFTPGLLSATGVTEGDFLPGGGSTFFIPGTIDNVAGTILFNANTLIGNIPGVSGDGTLATIHFDARSPGTSPVTLSDAIVLNSALVSIGIEQAGGSVTVEGNVVPEPTHYAFVAALIFAGLLIVRRKATRTHLN